jgi:ABC-type uncharacterized transport system substrate-binding protein
MLWKKINIYDATYYLAKDFVENAKRNPLQKGHFPSVAVIMRTAIKEYLENRTDNN